MQNGFSLLEQGDRETVFPVCREHGLGYTPFSPLAGGWLTGKYRRGEAPPAGLADDAAARAVRGYSSDRVFDALETLERDAAERGVSMAGLALAWAARAQPELTAIVVGPGSRRPPGACVRGDSTITLSPADRDHLTEVFS